MASKVDKFNETCFYTWQIKVKGYLMRKKLWSVVKPLSTDEASTSVAVTRALSDEQQCKDEQASGRRTKGIPYQFSYYS
ncbi:hypothetical protein GOP47_0028517 [Adiantum capillus-veneris]|nr:hypothetical protein GOP47_0028517 [Adiantum capillus-veneris]